MLRMKLTILSISCVELSYGHISVQLLQVRSLSCVVIVALFTDGMVSCTDTLACYPFQQNDPFIIREIPDIFFGGNQVRIFPLSYCCAHSVLNPLIALL